MKIKRFFAKDTRSALKMIREEQGPDAVILSTRRTNQGVEILAADNADEKTFHDTLLSQSGLVDGQHLATGRPDVAADKTGTDHNIDIQNMHQELKALRDMMQQQLKAADQGSAVQQPTNTTHYHHALQQMGLTQGLIKELLFSVQPGTDLTTGWYQLQQQLQARLPIAQSNLLDEGGIIALVGPTGVGKTTTIAKLAARFALRYGKHNVAMVTTDNFRIGAHEQLKQFGKLMNVPVYVAGTDEQLSEVLTKLSHKQVVLVDTAGMSQRDMRLNDRMKNLLSASERLKPFLVMSSHTQASSLDEAVRAFGADHLAGCILTKLDEASHWGGSFSIAIRHDLPISFVCNGQRVPEDLHLARAKSLVCQAVRLMQKNRHTDSEIDRGVIHADS